MPPVEIPGAALSPPVVVLARGGLLAAYALQGHGRSSAPAQAPRTTGARQCVGIGAAAMDAAAAEVLETYRVGDKLATRIAGVTFSAEYHLALADPRAGFVGTRELALAIDAGGSGRVAVDKGLLKADLGLSITARPKARAAVSVQGSVITAQLRGVDDFAVKIKIPHLPEWLNWAGSRIVSWLAKSIAAKIGRTLSGMAIPVSRLNPVTIRLNGLHGTPAQSPDAPMNPIQLSLFVSALHSQGMASEAIERLLGTLATREQALQYLQAMKPH